MLQFSANRAIALSNVETKIFEAFILRKVRVDSEYDAPQFRFKTGHTTGLCTATVKKTIEYYVNGSVMYLLISLILRKHLIG